MVTDSTAGFGKIGFDGIGLKISRIAHNNCPKSNIYLVSKTYLLIFL